MPAMGIIRWVKDFFFRYKHSCRGCGKPLTGMQEYACSDRCQEKAEWMDAIK